MSERTLGEFLLLFKSQSQLNPSLEVTGIADDSRQVKKGDLFFALSGTKNEGSVFADEAIARGAVAVVSEQELSKLSCVQVENARLALALAADKFYDQPSKKLRLTGITGTNGKTTTNWIIYHLLQKLEQSAVRIGTLGIESPFLKKESLTTPGSLELQKLLAATFQAKIRDVVLEVSSHGLSQDRVSGISFDVAVFTNLTRDHLDYHADFDEYFNAKLKLFELLRCSNKDSTAVVCIDSDYGKKIRDYCIKNNLKILTYGKNSEADCSVNDYTQSYQGLSFSANFFGEEIKAKFSLCGEYNILNVLAALLVVYSYGYKLETILELLPDLPQVPGRLESVPITPKVFVDYAHTPDAIENVLRSAKEICRGKLWTIFGCGGDRDPGKRPQMALAAEKYSDYVVVTSDNPRTEDPDKIIADILKSGIKARIVEPDRKLAIEKTLKFVQPEDLIMILGKGHEDYQIIGTVKQHFSDQEVVREFYQYR